MEAFDPIQEEIELSKKMFDLNQILDFQTRHDVQIIRGKDYQYCCYVNKKVYAVALTPMFALVYGINRYLEHNPKPALHSEQQSRH